MPAAASAGARPRWSGIVLAAGSSRRMGRPKQLLPLGERCLLERVLDEVLASGLQEVILVLGHRAAEIRAAIRVPEPASQRLRIVENPEPGLGLSHSLSLGLAAARADSVGAAVFLGDQPGVSSRLIDQLLARFPERDRPILRPVFESAAGARVPGHPVLVARSRWPVVERLEGDRGLRDWLAEHPEWLAEIPIEGEPPPDVDTPEDYEALVDVPLGHRRWPSGRR